MGEKYRKIERTPWDNIIDRDYSYCECEEIDGVCALIKTIKVKKESIRTYDDGEPVKIVGSGCFWIQFAPKNKSWWLTCMLDECGKFKHAYFDVTNYNVIDGTKSWFYDLYLDVVIKKDGKCYILDEDELKEALDQCEIDITQFENSFVVAKNIVDEFGGEKIEKVKALCNKYYEKLSKQFDIKEEVKMHLANGPFELIKSGKKSVEIRLFDEKRRNLTIGDRIVFYNDNEEKILVKIIDFYQYDTFRELFTNVDSNILGFENSDIENQIDYIRQYYSESKEKENGVLGIRFIKL